IVIVVDDPAAQPELGKIVRAGVLLDVSFIAWDDVRDPSRLLADHTLAPTFRAPDILADPTGALDRIQREVAAGFARREWVERRCTSAIERLLRNLGSLDAERP